MGVVLLSQGQFSAGFEFYDARHDVPELKNPKPRLPFPEWRGEAVQGRRIAVWPEQGMGDQIMYARFARVLQERGADVTWLCRPELVPLFAANLPARVIAASGEVEFPDPDFWVMACSLAWRCGASLASLPASPYLVAAPEARGRIGVATRGNPHHANDVNRSLPGPAVRRLLNLPGAISLHPEDTGARDFAATAQIIAGLDLVISVDTSVAHLAGAMGKPVWILLPAISVDWRWGHSGERSRWYPSARLWRSRGDWGELIGEIEAELSTRATSP